MRERILQTIKVAQTNLARARERQKKWYERNARVGEFGEGDEVFILLPTSSNKLKAVWKGLYKVKRKVGTVNYEVETVVKRRSTKIYHVNMFRKWHTPHMTSFFGDVDLEYDADNGEAIPELLRLNEKGGKVKISSKPSEKQRGNELLLEEFNDFLQDKPGRTGWQNTTPKLVRKIQCVKCHTEYHMLSWRK